MEDVLVLAQTPILERALASEEVDVESDDECEGEDEEGAQQRKGCSKLGICKKSWTAPEDEILTEIVVKNGAQRWSSVASHLPGRMGKQCRERWFNHLCPEVKKGAWTEEEDQIIMDSVREYGTRWSYIVKMLPGRTDNAIKNRYNSAMRRQKRLQRLQEAVDRGEAKMPKPRARSNTAGGGSRKRKNDDVAGDEEELAHDIVAPADASGVFTGEAPEPGAAPHAKGKKAAKKAKASLPQMPDACKNLDGLPAFSPTREERMAQLAAMLTSGGDAGGNGLAREELIDLLMNQSISPPPADLESKVLDAKAKDASPFDFSTALQDFSPSVVGMAADMAPPSAAPSSQSFAPQRVSRRIQKRQPSLLDGTPLHEFHPREDGVTPPPVAGLDALSSGKPSGEEGTGKRLSEGSLLEMLDFIEERGRTAEKPPGHAPTPQDGRAHLSPSNLSPLNVSHLTEVLTAF